MQIIALALVLTFSACKKDKGDKSPASSPSPTSTTDAPGENEDSTKTGESKDSSPIMQLVAGGKYNCALLYDSGEIKCWGEGELAQLGHGKARENIGDAPDEMGDKLSAVKLGGGRTAKAVSAGGNHTCAILDNDTVKCWGYGGKGRLGRGNEHLIGDEDGETEKPGTVDLGNGRTAKAISAGGDHTCAILDNDMVKCWGSGSSGMLGQGDTENRGDAENEMGENLPAIDFGDSHTAKAISVGLWHACAIMDNDMVKCWGNGRNGMLGQGNTENIGDEEDEIKDMTAVDLGTGRTAKAISAGRISHTCAILDDDTVKCWGKGTTGKLGYGNRLDRGDEPNEMGDNLPVVNLGTGRTAKAISAGGNHTCVILDDDTAKCWGSGSYGNLAMGNTDRIGDNTGEMAKLKAIDLGEGRTVKTIVAGESHVCSLLDNNTVKCWGRGYHGQLGNGKTDNLGDEKNEVGDNLPTVDLGFNPKP